MSINCALFDISDFLSGISIYMAEIQYFEVNWIILCSYTSWYNSIGPYDRLYGITGL